MEIYQGEQVVLEESSQSQIVFGLGVSTGSVFFFALPDNIRICLLLRLQSTMKQGWLRCCDKGCVSDLGLPV
jgi:hypothetical protein